MRPEIIITTASHNDIPLIQKIAYATWPLVYEPIVGTAQLNYMLELIYSAPALERQMQNGSTFLLAQEKNETLAFAAYFLKSQHIYKVDKLYALPNQRGKGLGKLLMNHIIDSIRSLEAIALHLNVNRYNIQAKNFYEYLKFKVLEEVDIPIGEGYYMNDYVMELKL